MQDSQLNEIVIVRRKSAWEEDHTQHGVWKIAYADFMTAMMAFFLVMWLINVTDDSVRRGVAQYFNPVKLASTAPNQKGLNDPNVMGDTNEDGADQAEGDRGPGSAIRGSSSGAANGAGREQETRPGQFQATQSEDRLFNDPYAVLDTLAQTVAVDLGDLDMPTAIGAGQAREAGAQGGDAYRDPFDPLYWQFLPNRDLGKLRKQTGAAENGMSSAVAIAEPVDVFAPRPEGSGEAQAVALKAAPGEGSTAAKPLTGTLDGTEPVRVVGGVAVPVAKGAERPEPVRTAESSLPAPPDVSVTVVAGRVSSPAPRPTIEVEKVEVAVADKQDVVARVDRILKEASRKGLDQTASRVSVSRSDEGVLISLTDDQSFGMFAIGSAEPRPELVKLLEHIGKELSAEPGAIVIKGHTDARPFKSRAYDNWRLSSDRAHMALYMLSRGGIDKNRFERVEGYADRDLKQPDDPLAASNRRVEILIREAM